MTTEDYLLHMMRQGGSYSGSVPWVPCQQWMSTTLVPTKKPRRKLRAMKGRKGR